jgi:hypothetical protein
MIVISKYEKELNQSKLQMEEKERMFNEKIKTANLNIQKQEQLSKQPAFQGFILWRYRDNLHKNSCSDPKLQRRVEKEFGK